MEIQATVPGTPTAGDAPGARLIALRRWNGAMGALHLAQGAAMLAVRARSPW